MLEILFFELGSGKINKPLHDFLCIFKIIRCDARCAVKRSECPRSACYSRNCHKDVDLVIIRKRQLFFYCADERFKSREVDTVIRTDCIFKICFPAFLRPE